MGTRDIYTVPTGKKLQIHDVILASDASPRWVWLDISAPSHQVEKYILVGLPLPSSSIFSHKFSNIILDEGEILHIGCREQNPGGIVATITGTLFNK
jgi:hypothetical protein